MKIKIKQTTVLKAYTINYAIIAVSLLNLIEDKNYHFALIAIALVCNMGLYLLKEYMKGKQKKINEIEQRIHEATLRIASNLMRLNAEGRKQFSEEAAKRKSKLKEKLEKADPDTLSQFKMEEIHIQGIEEFTKELTENEELLFDAEGTDEVPEGDGEAN